MPASLLTGPESNSRNTAREATDRERDRLEREWTHLENEVAAGRASFTGEDEDGQIVYDLGDHVGEMLSDIESVLRIVREAFTISLHHFWERQLKQLMKAKDYSEADAFNFLKGIGIAPDEPTLKALRLTANVAKHSEGLPPAITSSGVLPRPSAAKSQVQQIQASPAKTRCRSASVPPDYE